MAIVITNECTLCGACEVECPNTAIYEQGADWRYSDGTILTEVELENGEIIDADTPMPPISGGSYGADGDEFFYIVPSKCTECTGFHEEPACALVCPVDACVPDPEYVESESELLAKKHWLHGE